ncbi:substrate-binding periplasmic protein [Thalassotalea euphylliae]|nr:transporter substrate-binding domain-containing protein [Thalassotalea euphylliae]
MNLVRLFFALLLCIMVLPTTQAEPCQSITVSAHENYPPFHWYHDGEFYGVTIDITKQLLERYQVDYQVSSPVPWKRLLEMAKHGRTDLLLGLKDTPARREFLNFTSAPVLNNPVAVFVKKGEEFSFIDWRSLIGKVGNINLGDSHGEAFDNFANQYLNIQQVKGLAQNFQMVLRGRADYFVTGYYPGISYLSNSGLKDEIVALTPFAVDGYIHFGFVKDSGCDKLLARFNQDLASLIKTETIAQLFEKNLMLWQAQLNGERQRLELH